MSALIRVPLRRLALAMADLRDRVREALAGEIARAVADAVRDVVEAVLQGGAPSKDVPPPVSAPSHAVDGWSDPDLDPWDDAPEEWREEQERGPSPPIPERSTMTTPESLANAEMIYRPAIAPAAVAAGLSAGRWWLRRRGSLLEAIGVGVLVAVTVLVGGPMARTGAVVVSAAADLSAATDALGKGADRLNQL